MTVSVEARAVSVLTLNNGQLAVDMEGVALTDLVNAVNQSGGTLQIADKPGHIVTGAPLPPGASLSGICCSTAHITTDDNRLLYQASHQYQDYGDAEWLHFTGTGYLIRLNAWQYPLLRLKTLGVSKACRRLIASLIRRHGISLLHLDAAGDVLPGVDTFDW